LTGVYGLLAGMSCLALVSIGCEGDPGGGVTDGGFEKPTNTGGIGGGTGGTGGGGKGGGGSTDVALRPDTPPPTPAANAIKILPGQTDLLGSFETGCTFGPGGERWCAVSRPLSLSKRELWFVNVTKAAAAKSLVAACDMPGVCVKASSNIYTAQPDTGPAYPADSAHASGNTFIFLTDAKSAPSDPFEGDVWVHTVGSPNAVQIGKSVFDCAVAGQRLIQRGSRRIDKVVGICAGNPASAPGDAINKFTLTGGVVAGQTAGATPTAPLTPMAGDGLGTVTTIYPVHPATNALRWRVGFTADGESVLLSQGGATEAEVEKLVIYKSDDLGKGGQPTPFTGGDNITRWTLSADGKKIFFFKEYNYNAMGNQSGTLWVADFPSGANPRELKGMRVPGGSANAVGTYRVLVDLKGVDQGVGVLTGLVMGQGNYSIIKNVATGSLDDIANVPTVAMRTRSLPLPSPDLRFSLFAQQFSDADPTSDIWIVKNDGTGLCALTTGINGGIFGFPFTDNAGLVFWADNYDPPTLSADGLYTDPSDCTNPGKKKKFSNHADFWFVDADRMLLYSDESNGAQVSLKYAFINGNTLGPPVTIQERADRFFHILLDAQPADGSPARFKGIVYTLSGGGDAVNGAYYYELPAGPGGTPTPDASAGN
jgi:hypothetical protein